jgi:hypothetical protein
MYVSKTQTHSAMHVTNTGVFHKLGKKYIGSQRTDSISGIPAHIMWSGRAPMDQNPTGPDTQVAPRYTASYCSSNSAGKSVGTVGRSMYSYDQGGNAYQVTVAKHLPHTLKSQFMAGHAVAGQPVCSRLELVAGGPVALEWSTYSGSASRSTDGV